MGILKKEYLPHYTFKDYQCWEGRWELIEGIPYAMAPMPHLRHQYVSNKIAWLLHEKLKHCKHCKALLPVDWKINEDTIVQPDNLVVCAENIEEILKAPFLTKPPILIFEVLSPSSRSKDKVLKFNIYQEAGVKYYVLVDPEEEIVEIFQLKNKKYEKQVAFKREGKFGFKINDCKIDFEVEKIFT